MASEDSNVAMGSDEFRVTVELANGSQQVTLQKGAEGTQVPAVVRRVRIQARKAKFAGCGLLPVFPKTVLAPEGFSLVL